MAKEEASWGSYDRGDGGSCGHGHVVHSFILTILKSLLSTYVCQPWGTLGQEGGSCGGRGGVGDEKGFSGEMIFKLSLKGGQSCLVVQQEEQGQADGKDQEKRNMSPHLQWGEWVGGREWARRPVGGPKEDGGRDGEQWGPVDLGSSGNREEEEGPGRRTG